MTRWELYAVIGYLVIPWMVSVLLRQAWREMWREDYHEDLEGETEG